MSESTAVRSDSPSIATVWFRDLDGVPRSCCTDQPGSAALPPRSATGAGWVVATADSGADVSDLEERRALVSAGGSQRRGDVVQRGGGEPGHLLARHASVVDANG